MATAAPAPPRPGAVAWLRDNLFSTWFNSILTLAALFLLVRALPPLFDWGVTHAVWGPPAPTSARKPTAPAGR